MIGLVIKNMRVMKVLYYYLPPAFLSSHENRVAHADHNISSSMVC